MAVGAVSLIGKTVESLYVSSEPSPIHLTVESALAGVTLGVVVSILAALAPAVEAAYVAPVEAMARGREDYNTARRSRTTIWWAIFMLTAGAGLSQLPAIDGRPLAAYAAVLYAYCAGDVRGHSYRGHAFSPVGPLRCYPTRLLGTEALLALRSLRASLSRTSVLTAALTTAVAMTVSVGIMVGSFRQTVAVWVDNQLKADFYRAARPVLPRPTVILQWSAGRDRGEDFPSPRCRECRPISRVPHLPTKASQPLS